jgi:phospholipid/cholesterol/gamma-HCH transport system substrate-binding protein
METRAHYIIVGSFLILLMVSSLIFVLWLSRTDFGSKAALYDIYFQGSVTGLRINEDVRYHGLPIGKVKEIIVDPENIDRVRVRVAINEPKLIREDSMASIEIQGLTGYTYVQIQGKKQTSPLLKAKVGHPYPIISSQPSRIDLLFSDIPHVLSSIYQLSEQLRELFNEKNRQEINTFIKNASTISQILAEGKQSIKALNQDVQNTLSHINELALMIHPSLISFKDTVEELHLLLKVNKEPVNEAFRELPRTIKQLRTVSYNFQKLINEFERNPLKLFSKSDEQGYKLP